MTVKIYYGNLIRFEAIPKITMSKYRQVYMMAIPAECNSNPGDPDDPERWGENNWVRLCFF